MTEFHTVLPYPISANRYWRPVRIGSHITIVPTSEAKRYKADVAALCRGQGARVMPGRVAIKFALYPKRPQDFAKRIRKFGPAWDDTVQCLDLDNAQKVLLDALKGVVIDDDKWVREITGRRAAPDDRGARVELTVRMLAPFSNEVPLFESATTEGE